MARRKPTAQQEEFCQRFTTHWNATRAAKEAKYSEKSAMVLGHQLLKNPLVQERITQLSEHALREMGVTRERVLSEIARIAFSDVRRAYGPTGEMIDPQNIPDELAPAVAGIEVDEIWSGRGQDREQIGETKKLKLWDKNTALQSLAKHLGLTPEKHELSGPNGKPIETRDVTALTDEQLEAKINGLLLKAGNRNEK